MQDTGKFILRTERFILSFSPLDKHTWECHLFIGPIGAGKDEIERFMVFCDKFQKDGEHEVKGRFKGLRLKLCFDQVRTLFCGVSTKSTVLTNMKAEVGDVTVLQTSHYITDTAENAKKLMYEVGKKFTAAGFDVNRCLSLPCNNNFAGLET